VVHELIMLYIQVCTLSCLFRWQKYSNLRSWEASMHGNSVR